MSIMWNMVNPINSKYGVISINGIPSASEGEGLAGRGTKKKRMPSCNGRDRGFYNERIIYRRNTPSRKTADFKGGGD